MRRSLLSSIIAAALVPAASLWAAPNIAAPSGQLLNQISEQAYRIQSQADGLEAYLRSGAHEFSSAAAYTNDMADSAQKLAGLLDQFASQPGATNATRQQADKMKLALVELRAFIGNTVRELDSRAMPLHVEDALATTSGIAARGNSIRSAAEAQAGPQRAASAVGGVE